MNGADGADGADGGSGSSSSSSGGGGGGGGGGGRSFKAARFVADEPMGPPSFYDDDPYGMLKPRLMEQNFN